MSEIISQVLRVFYKNFGASILMAAMAMFVWSYFEKYGFKKAIQTILLKVKTEKELVWRFVFLLYLFMLLFETILCRPIWGSPLRSVIGIWGLHDLDGALYTENIENCFLFIPFVILLLVQKEIKPLLIKIKGRYWLVGLGVGLGGSCIIEFTQLLLKIGTWQLSDLFYNTLGGLIGGSIYWIGLKLFFHKE